MIPNIGRGFTAEEVERLHREAFTRGPWFSADQCEGLSTILNNIFAVEVDGGISPSAEAVSSLPCSYAVWKRRRDAVKLLMDVSTLPSEKHRWLDAGEEQAMADLKVALERAEHFIAPSRTKIRHWAAITVTLAAIVAELMKEAGFEHIPTTRNSRLAHFLELILPRFIDDDPPGREAIGMFLNERGGNGFSAAELLAGE